MANYSCTIRTNYFQVKDEAAFLDLMSLVYGEEGYVEVWKKIDKTGAPIFGFGCHGGIAGVKYAREDEDVDASAYDEFIDGLQTCVADNDAIIILESGHENLRYVVGQATIITAKECKVIDLTHAAINLASELLGNPTWSTICEY